jgi:hypothetical protein
MTTRHACTWPASPCAWCEDTINHLHRCGRPGCGNYLDDRDPTTGELATTVDPDNPYHSIELWCCNLCLDLLDSFFGESGCGYCIDGWMPVFNAALGPAYRTCPYCRAECLGCHGIGRFSANFFDYDDGQLVYDNSYLIEAFADHYLRPYFCTTCHGLVVVLPIRHTAGGDQS